MQTTGNFDIIIQMPASTEGQPNSGTPAQPTQTADPVQNDPARGDKKQDGGGSATIAAVAANLAINAGKQALNSAVSNIGLATGNSYKQQQVQQMLSGITTVATVGGMLVSGNYAGAAAVAISTAISFASETYQMNKQREIDNYTAAQYAIKIGYTNGRK